MRTALAPKTIRFRCDPRLGGLQALGVESAEELLGTRELTVRRSEPLDSLPNRSRLRFALPGTPKFGGKRLSGAPRGAGTGWVVLERFRGSRWRELWTSRLTHPRSASLAERRWNLLCHLRANGVATPEPLVVGARGTGPVSRDSFLVTRELDDFESVPSWLARETRVEERRAGLRALGAVLGKLLGAGVRMPRLAPAHFVISVTGTAPGSACGTEAGGLPGGLPGNRMPAVALVEVDGGAMCSRLATRAMAEMIGGLDDEALELTPRERIRILRHALADLEPSKRRAVKRMLRG